MAKSKAPLKQELERLGSGQKTALANALREMLDLRVNITRDRLREWAKVDNNAASIALRGFKEGLFAAAEPVEEAPTQRRPAERAWWDLPQEARELVESMHGRAVSVPDGYSDMTIGEGLVLASLLGLLISPRRRAALIRFAELLLVDELPLAEHEMWEDFDAEKLDAWLAGFGIGLRDGTRDQLPDDDPGMAAIASMQLGDLGPWRAACADQQPATIPGGSALE